MTNIFQGISDYSTAFRLISKLRLWGYFLIPCLISLVIGVGVLYLAWSYSDNLGDYLANFYPWNWGKNWVDKAATAVGALSILIIAVVVYKYILLILLAPFLSPLTQKIEEHITGIPFKGGGIKENANAMWRGLRISSYMVFRELLFVIFLTILGIIPLFSPFTTVMIFLIQSYYAGMGNMDFTLERHFKMRESIQFTKQNRGLAIGNGILFILMLFIPILGLIMAPVLGAAAGAVSVANRLANK